VVVFHGKLARYAVPAYRGLIGCLDKLGLTEDAAKARQEFTVRYPDAAKAN